MPPARKRADVLLVERGLFESRARARAAIEAEPTFLTAYNTLAVVYLRRGALMQAERVLAQLLALEPANAAALPSAAKS